MKMFEKLKSKNMYLVFAQVSAMGLMLVTSSASATIHVATDDTVWGVPSLPLNLALNKNPGNLTMYEYVPETVPSEGKYVGGVVVLLHGCGQDAAEFASESGWVGQANLHGFSIIAPQQNTANNGFGCFNWFNPDDQRRGGGEPGSIVQMIENFAQRRPDRYDADNVQVSGFSAGGGMAAVLLALYPDVFSGAAIMAGVPFKCATNANDGWSCMKGTSGSFGQSAQDWGDRVRGARSPVPNPWCFMFGGNCPGWPANRLTHVSIFGGTQDTVVVPVNADALVMQWTNFLSVSSVSYTGPVAIGTPTIPSGTSTTVSHDERNYSNTVYKVTHHNGIHEASIVETAEESCGRDGQDVKAVGLCSTTQAMKNWGW